MGPMKHRKVDPAKFRACREAAGLSQVQLSRTTGFSRSYIRAVETGDCQPGDLYASALAAVLGCDVTDFSDPKNADAA